MTGTWVALALATASTGSAVAQTATTSGAPVTTAALVDRTVLDRYVGTYRSDDWTAKVAVSKKGQLTLQIDGLAPVVLIADSEAQFHPAGIKATLLFHTEADGSGHFILQREGTQIRAIRKRGKA